MKFLAVIRHRIKGITDAFERYALTIVFLITTAVLISLQIHTGTEYDTFQLTCIVGAFLSIVLQAAYERFFVKRMVRVASMAACAVLAFAYYLLIHTAPEISPQIGIRTSVMLFGLAIGYMYIPSAKNRISFNESFMVTFKAFFQAVLFAGVLFAGCAMILGAIDTLIVDIDSDFYDHTANFVFVLFAPIFLLSLIPLYPGKKEDGMDQAILEEQNEIVQKAARSPKFLDILVSYIIIPIAAMFTVILVVYIIINVGGEFWTDNLLEPMLVSYAVGIILLCVLSGKMDNKLVSFFRKVFPKVLIPIVLFQIAASLLSLGDTGLTHTRYYVILFGLFAAVSGVLLSLGSARKTGLVALMLIAFATVSIVPPVDAFSLSKKSQTDRLESVLVQNGMIDNNTIVPNANVSDEDKEEIIASVEYLEDMGYIDQIPYLPDEFDYYTDFYDTFGFNAYIIPSDVNRSLYIALDASEPLDIEGYDAMVMSYIDWADKPDTENQKPETYEILRDNHRYTLTKVQMQQQNDIQLLDENGSVMIGLDTEEILSWLKKQAVSKTDVPQEDATFLTRNETIRMAVVVTSAHIERYGNTEYTYAEIVILIEFI